MHPAQHSSPGRRSFHTSRDSLNLSSVDTTPSIAFMAQPTTSLAASLKSKEKQNPSSGSATAAAAAATTPVHYKHRPGLGNALFDVELPDNMILHPNCRAKVPHSSRRSNSIVDIVGMSTNPSSRLQIPNSRTGNNNNPREIQLARAIDRAVKLSKSTHHNSNSCERKHPLTFRRLFSWSRSGQKLLDICFEATLQTTDKTALAHQEREAWSQVPAYLVAIVHDNQASTATMDHSATSNTHDNRYKALAYSPPTTEEQLQDYAGACAAAQTAIHSLQGDGYRAEWVTSPVTKTPAFRTLVKAKPTDRIAALIKVDDRPRPKSEQSFSGRQR